MGKKDVAMNVCLRQPKYFADCWNAILWANGVDIGEYVIDELSLNADSTELLGMVRRNSYHKENDARMILCQCLENGNIEEIGVLAIEQQTRLHRAMVARTVIYDAFAYLKQLNTIRRIHERQNDIRGDEYVARFSRNDYLVPSITAVIYIGRKEWREPLELHGLMKFGGNYDCGQLKQIVNQYCNNARMLVLDVCHVEQRVIDCMKTDMKHLFNMLRCCNKKSAMWNYVYEHEDDFDSMPWDIAIAIAICCGLSELEEFIKDRQQGGMVEMCRAWTELKRDWKREARREGLAEGRAEGRVKGREEGRKEGREEGREEGENRMTSLVAILLNANQIEELRKATENIEYRNQLFLRYGI